MAAHLARAPLVLVVTILAAIPVVYFTAQPSFVKGIAPRWQIPEDLLYFTSYCLVVVAVLSVLVRLSAPRYVLVILTVAWTTILFGPGAVATVAAVGVTAYLLGAWLLDRSAGDSRAPWPVPLAFALGYAVLLGLFQAAVVIGLYNRFVVVLVVSVVCWLSRARILADSARLRAWIVEPMSGGWWSIAPLLIISIQLVYASFAETHSDALAIHLMIPHQISMIGTWKFDAATYTFAVMPKAANWLFTAHYLLAGESAARLFNATATFMTGWLIFDVVRRQVGREAGALLAAMFLSAPLTFWAVFVMLGRGRDPLHHRGGGAPHVDMAQPEPEGDGAGGARGVGGDRDEAAGAPADDPNRARAWRESRADRIPCEHPCRVPADGRPGTGHRDRAVRGRVVSHGKPVVSVLQRILPLSPLRADQLRGPPVDGEGLRRPAVRGRRSPVARPRSGTADTAWMFS